jgi:hypothetical protein
MAWSASPNEVRIEYSPDDIASIGRSFVWVYAGVTLVALVAAALLRPELLVFVVGFAVFVAVWSRRMLGTRHEPYSLVLTRDELAVTYQGERRRVARRDVASARVRHLYGKPTTRHVVELFDRAGAKVFSESMNEGDAPIVEAGLEDLGWPVGVAADDV